MFHTTNFPQVTATLKGRQRKQMQFRQLAHSLDKRIQHELKAFAQAVGFSARHRLIAGYRLRKAIQPGLVTWWIEKDIPPADRYHCAAYQVKLRQTASGQNELFLQSGRQKYPVDLKDLSTLHDALRRAGSDPALVIPRQMGVAFD